MSPVSPEAIRAAPKALLHDHLDGGLRVATVIELADKIGWALPSTDESELQRWFTAGAASLDLLAYLATFEHTLAVMQSAENIERIAREAVHDLVADGVVYAEIRYAPELHQLPAEASIEAICSGFRAAEATAAAAGAPITVNLIVCAMRTEQRSDEIVRVVDRVRRAEPKVVAFDLAGAETGWPPSMHAEALRYARENHLNITIHASEPPDLELISDALAHGTHRIGHGVRLQADMTIENGEVTAMGTLARYVLDRGVHLEMAPTCHVHVGAVPNLESHPIGPMVRAGFNVGVNTDNRLMSDVMPSSELWDLHQAQNLTWGEIEQLVVNAVSSSFAPVEERRRIIDTVVRPAYSDLSLA